MDKNNLAFMAGVGGGFNSEFIDIRVDNGDDISGTNATGEFVHKVGKVGSYVRTTYGSKIEGIILVQRASLSLGEQWFTDEFNPLDALELINIRMTANPKKVSGKLTYKQIQEKFPKIQGHSGQMKNPFNYKVQLYIQDQKDTSIIYRLQLSGKSMGNWIQFKQAYNVNVWETTIIMEIIEEKNKAGKVSYGIDFKIGTPVDSKGVRLFVQPIVDSFKTPERLTEIGDPEQPEDIPTIQLDEQDVKIETDVENISYGKEKEDDGKVYVDGEEVPF